MRGDFTLPGESGYEQLTLDLAKRWGADVIRDSDGTTLSDEIINYGYGIYSTICIIRNHNEWAKENRDALQQTFLTSQNVLCHLENGRVEIDILEGYFKEQMEINESAESLEYWQVYDRTLDIPVSKENWNYDKATKRIIISNCSMWHSYSVSFLAYRIWEEISMYNHTTNNWDSPHLMQIDPIYPKAQEYLLNWMEDWCKSHPATTVVRFTSMFYNFAWIWGDSLRNRSIFTDWASYDFTVSPLALNLFKEKFGYSLTAEDFVNKGKYMATHVPPTENKLKWMSFVHGFVVDFGKKLVDIVHKYGKKAYVFYDDSWVGVEPYGERFKDFGFDGMIKCVFSGFEVRLCAGVKTDIHEIRLHPYLFPVGLSNKPTFMEGGDPAKDALEYWNNVRRALLREKIDRIGLGGYLHLTESFPDFCDCIEDIADLFREIKSLHERESSGPYVLKPRVAVLHSWGKLRSWTLSGHFHETNEHDLIHILESLSGLPLDISFISFEEVIEDISGFDVIINAGREGSAWSGSQAWGDPRVVESLTRWVYDGGTFIGVNEPSAYRGESALGGQYLFKMAHVLGIDKDTGGRVCHGKWSFDVTEPLGLVPEGLVFEGKEDIYLTDGNAAVYAACVACATCADKNSPVFTVNEFGKGKGIYLSGFTTGNASTRFLLDLILFSQGEELMQSYITDNSDTECAYFEKSRTLVVINNSAEEQRTAVMTDKGKREFNLKPYETVFMELAD